MDNMIQLSDSIELYARLAREWGSAEAGETLASARASLAQFLAALQTTPIDEAMRRREPDDLQAIRALRPKVENRMKTRPAPGILRDKLEAAMLCRFAGCTLGAIVEGWSIARMEAWADRIGDAFPPERYWSEAWSPHEVRYGMSEQQTYTEGRMRGVPVDDDVTYTLLGLLIVEKYGLNFTLEDVGKAWLEWLPMACTAEDIALKNLKKGIPASLAAERDNPYCQWIGAAIRSDPWAYIAAGWPEKAAELAWRDATLSHRRNGIYGEMYLAAAQAAAFAVDDARAALETGLQEIPEHCALAEDLRWALSTPARDWRHARRLVDERFSGMHSVHTNNNLCLVVYGLLLGGRDVTRVLGETVAMGLVNDCTAASAGSIIGAVSGKDAVPERWTRGFDRTVRSYLNGYPSFDLTDLTERFAKAGDGLW